MTITQRTKYVISIIILFGSGIATAQDYENKLFYLDLGGGWGTHTRLKVGANYVLPSQHMFSGALSMYIKKAEGLPVNYSPGPDGYPKEKTFTVSAMYGKMFGPSRSARLAVKAGVAFGSNEYYYITEAPLPGGGNGLSAVHTSELVYGLSANPVIEIPLGNRIGISAGVNANIMKSMKPILCGEISLMIGDVRW